MSSLSRAAGVGPRITLGGRSLSVRAKLVESLAEIEAEIVKLRGNPFDCVRQAAEALHDKPDVLDRIVDRAFFEAQRWNFVSQADIQEFMTQSRKGMMFCLWLSVRDNDPSPTLEEVETWVSNEFSDIFKARGEKEANEWMKSLFSAMNQADGEDELGNSNGSPSVQAEDLAGQSAGNSSSET